MLQVKNILVCLWFQLARFRDFLWSWLSLRPSPPLFHCRFSKTPNHGSKFLIATCKNFLHKVTWQKEPNMPTSPLYEPEETLPKRMNPTRYSRSCDPSRRKVDEKENKRTHLRTTRRSAPKGEDPLATLLSKSRVKNMEGSPVPQNSTLPSCHKESRPSFTSKPEELLLGACELQDPVFIPTKLHAKKSFLS